MPRAKPELRAGKQTDLPDAVRHLTTLSLQWAQAEYSLARAESGSLLRRLAAGLGLALCALLLSFVALVIFAQAAVAGLSQLLAGPVYAGLAVGIVLLIAVVLLMYFAIRLVTLRGQRPLSPVLRWVMGPNDHEQENL